MTDAQLETWLQDVRRLTDCIVYLSNRHGRGHDKGCLRGTPPNTYCRANFPRALYPESVVDWVTGSVQLRQTEEWLNTFNITLTYLLRCNTDVTCLLSSTQVRAIIAYVTDYVTKSSLKTHAVFETIKAVLDRKTEILNTHPSASDAARAVLVKIVNGLTAKSESPGPMTCAYLLGQPDHYTPETFRVFYWWPFTKHVHDTAFTSPGDVSQDVRSEKVILGYKEGRVIGRNHMQDYTCRPSAFEKWSLYDYMRETEVKKLSSKDRDHNESSGAAHVGYYCLTSEHPLHNTHGVFMAKKRDHLLLNFVGGTLPRRDQGDHEAYCRAMLTMFAPEGWRSGIDLKADDRTWTSIFEDAQFAPSHLAIMENMHLLYECYDAKHDWAA
ncbi:hypothetical protein BDW22DRAFT_1459677, partial [Trametopsis cervina]